MSSQNPVRAFESFLEQAGNALISASPQQACALLSKALTQFEIVLSDPSKVTAAALFRMREQIRSITRLADHGERTTSTWLEAIAPAAEIQRSGGIDICSGGLDIYG